MAAGVVRCRRGGGVGMDGGKARVAREGDVMALCGYCGAIEVAWHQEDRKWVACAARRHADGTVLRVEVRSGTRTVLRPVPDPAARHYPWADRTKRTLKTECEAWTPEKALASKGRKGGWSRRPPEPVAAIPPPSIPVAAPVATATIGVDMGKAEASAKPSVKPSRSSEPEALIDAAELAAWARAEAAIRCEVVPMRVLLWGPPGTGKTELPWRIAQELEWAHEQQQMTEETPGTELLGHLIVQAGSTVWCDGTLGRAIRASHAGPVVYVIDEVARASQDAMSACLLALTNPESLRLTLRSGEVLSPNVANWHVVATSNDDPKDLPPALGDRLHIAVRITAPHPDLVRSMTTVEARRLACARSREYSIRALLTYDRLRAGGVDMGTAAGMVWEPEVARSFTDAARLERIA